MQRAFISATPSQLRAINIDETFITNMTCVVVDIDQYENSVGKCTRCIMHLHFNNTVDEFIIPTQWLKFISSLD